MKLDIVSMRSVFRLAALVCVCGLAVALYLVVFRRCSLTDWRKSTPNERLQIAECISRREELLGMSYGEVKSLLGSPDRHYIRYEKQDMYLDLKDEHVLSEPEPPSTYQSAVKNKTRSEIIDVLGKPDREWLVYEINERPFTVVITAQKVIAAGLKEE